MLAPAQDKVEYAETILERTQPAPTYSPAVPNIQPHEDEAAHAFKYRFINKQIKNAKAKFDQVENPHTLSQLGDMYLLRDNYKRAVSYFLRAVELDPKFIPAYEKIVLAYLSHKEFDKANHYYLKLLEATSRRPDILHGYALFKAFLYEGNQDIEEALSVLEEILKLDPSNCEAINTYGFILLVVKNEIEKAKEYFNKVLEINTSFIHSINNLGVCYLNQKDFKRAEGLFLRGIEVAPTYTYSYQNLASSYISQEKYQDALDILKKGKYKQIRLDATWEHKIGWLLIKLRKIEEATDWYERKLKEEPNNDLLYNNLGVCLRSLNKHDQAEQCFERAVKLFKSHNRKFIQLDYLKSFYNLGRVAIDKADADKLYRISQDILAIHPEDAFGMYLSGAYYSMIENFDEAKKIFEETFSVDKKIPEIYPDYGFILESVDRNHEAAITLLEEAASHGFYSPLIDNNLAFAYIKSNQLKKAEAILSRYDIKNAAGVLLATKGLLELKQGNFEEGKEYYEAAIKTFSGKNLRLAKQIFAYEKAVYWFDKNEIEKAEEELREAEEYPRSYMSQSLQELRNDINKSKQKTLSRGLPLP